MAHNSKGTACSAVEGSFTLLSPSRTGLSFQAKQEFLESYVFSQRYFQCHIHEKKILYRFPVPSFTQCHTMHSESLHMGIYVYTHIYIYIGLFIFLLKKMCLEAQGRVKSLGKSSPHTDIYKLIKCSKIESVELSRD